MKLEDYEDSCSVESESNQISNQKNVFQTTLNYDCTLFQPILAFFGRKSKISIIPQILNMQNKNKIANR